MREVFACDNSCELSPILSVDDARSAAPISLPPQRLPGTFIERVALPTSRQKEASRHRIFRLQHDQELGFLRALRRLQRLARRRSTAFVLALPAGIDELVPVPLGFDFFAEGEDELLNA
jgi:hypothetical protein